MIVVKRKSSLSGKENVLSLPIDRETYLSCYQHWKDGTLIQDAFPMLNATQREFIKTGVTDEEWATMFNDETEEECA